MYRSNIMVAGYSLCLKSNRGGALVVMMLTLLLVSVGVLTGLSNGHTQQAALQRHHDRLQALRQARENLIAYAVLYADNYPASGAGPGHLPCPDLDPPDDGIETNDGPNPPCGKRGQRLGRMPRFTYSRDTQVSQTNPGQQMNSGQQMNKGQQTNHGRPQKRLEFYPPRSLIDQQLWYLVSDQFINNPRGRIVNLSTVGNIQLTTGQRVAAVIFSPGRELSQLGQLRPSDHYKDYLESILSDPFVKDEIQVEQRGNDLITTMTMTDMHQALLKRVAGHVQSWFEQYSTSVCSESSTACFPFAGDKGICQKNLYTGTLPLLKGDCDHELTVNGRLDGVDAQQHWFVRNQWSEFVRYNVLAACIDGLVSCDTSVSVAAGNVQINVIPTAALGGGVL